MKLNWLLIVGLLFCMSAGLIAQPTMRITKLDADQGSLVDIDFTVDNYTRILGFQFSVRWNPAVIQFHEAKNLNSAALQSFSVANNFGFNASEPDRVNISYSNPSFIDTTLANGTRLFTITFRVTGNVGSMTAITLGDIAGNEIEFLDNRLMNLGVIQDPGRVTVTGMGAPGLRFIAGQVQSASGTSVCVPISVNNFNNIGAFQYTISWNPAFMRFEALGNTNININSSNVQVNNTNGTLTVSWNSATGETRADGTTIFNVCFFITGTSGCSDVNFTGNPLMIEAALSNGTPVTVQTTAGRVCIDGQPDCVPNGLTVSLNRVTVMNDESFCLQYRVFNFRDIQSLQMSMQWNPAIIEYLTVRDFRLPNFNTTNFNVTQTPNGRLAFLWFGDDPVDLVDNALVFELCFRAVGGAGSFTDINFNSVMVLMEATNGAGTVVPIHLCPGRVNIANVQPFTVNVVSSSNPTCEGSNNGSITVQTVGGMQPIASYVWTRDGNPITGNTPTINNLGAGLYRVVVTDAGGNTAATTVNLAPQFNIVVSAEAISPLCAGVNNGSITLNISGNTGGVTYDWGGGINSRDRNNLAPGSYTVTITYAGGTNSACTVIRTFTIADPQPITINHMVNNIDKSISLTVSGGASPYTYQWSPAGDNSPVISGLEPGAYFVTVTDANGCTSTGGPYMVLDTDDLILDIETSDYNGFGVSCFGTCDGFIRVTPITGVAPFTYRWNVSGITAAELTNRCVGTYNVTVTDGTGKTATAVIALLTPERIRVELVDFQASSGLNDGFARVSALGGAGGFVFNWSDGSTGARIENQGPIVNVVNVRDMNNCSVNFPVNFGNDSECYEHRKVITPNGDGLNDEFTISCLGGTINRLEVFDRYGKLVYAANNYFNNWQGTGPDGAVLPDGGYFFVLRVTPLGGSERIVRGSFNILYDLR